MTRPCAREPLEHPRHQLVLGHRRRRSRALAGEREARPARSRRSPSAARTVRRDVLGVPRPRRSASPARPTTRPPSRRRRAPSRARPPARDRDTAPRRRPSTPSRRASPARCPRRRPRAHATSCRLLASTPSGQSRHGPCSIACVSALGTPSRGIHTKIAARDHALGGRAVPPAIGLQPLEVEEQPAVDARLGERALEVGKGRMASASSVRRGRSGRGRSAPVGAPLARPFAATRAARVLHGTRRPDEQPHQLAQRGLVESAPRAPRGRRPA